MIQNEAYSVDLQNQLPNFVKGSKMLKLTSQQQGGEKL